MNFQRMTGRNFSLTLSRLLIMSPKLIFTDYVLRITDYPKNEDA